MRKSKNSNSINCTIALAISAMALIVSFIDANVKIPMIQEFHRRMGYEPKKMVLNAIVDIIVIVLSSYMTGKYGYRLSKYLKLFDDDEN